MARAKFTYNGGNLRRNLNELPERINRRVGVVVDANAAWGQSWARLNAPWSDDTGAARGGLFAFPESNGNTHTITFSHSVHYGIWLEIANSGKYQVILPAVRMTGAHLMNDLRRLLDTL